jgi:hypothetical protein
MTFVGGSMPILDRKKLEEAFKRAAWMAVHGTREERSGRFLHPQYLAGPGFIKEKPRREDELD